MNKEGCYWPRIQIHHHSRSNHQYLMFAILIDKERGSILSFQNVTYFKNTETSGLKGKEKLLPWLLFHSHCVEASPCWFSSASTSASISQLHPNFQIKKTNNSVKLWDRGRNQIISMPWSMVSKCVPTLDRSLIIKLLQAERNFSVLQVIFSYLQCMFVSE